MGVDAVGVFQIEGTVQMSILPMLEPLCFCCRALPGELCGLLGCGVRLVPPEAPSSGGVLGSRVELATAGLLPGVAVVQDARRQPPPSSRRDTASRTPRESTSSAVAFRGAFWVCRQPPHSAKHTDTAIRGHRVCKPSPAASAALKSSLAGVAVVTCPVSIRSVRVRSPR